MKKIKIIFGTCLTLFIIYVIFGFWGVPYIVKNILPNKLAENQINFQINEIKLNPLSLEIDASGIEFGTKSPIFKADKVYINLGFWPIFQKTIDITSLDIQKPQINVKLGKESNIAPLISDENNPSEKSEPSSVRIVLNGLKIKDASVEYDDDNNSISLDNINYHNSESVQELIIYNNGTQLNLKSINLGKSTINSNGVKVGFSGFEIDNKLELKRNDSKISLNVGKMSILGLSVNQSDADVKTNIISKNIGYELDLINNQSNVMIQEVALSDTEALSGVFRADSKEIKLSQIVANVQDTIEASINGVELNRLNAIANKTPLANISKIAIKNVNLNQDTIKVESVNVDETKLFNSDKNGFKRLNINQLSTNKKGVKIGNVALDKMEFKSVLTDDGLSILKPFISSFNANQADKSPNTSTTTNLNIADIALKDASVEINHKFKDEYITLKNDNINLKIDNFSLNDDFNIKLTAKDNLTDLNIDGKVQIHPLKAQIKIDIPNMSISPYYTYANPFLNAQIGGKGRLKLNANITLNNENYTVHSQANLNDISLIQNQNKSIAVDEIALKSLTLTQDSLNIDGLKISSAKADIIRQKDGKINLATLIKNTKKTDQENKNTKGDQLKLEFKNISLNDAEVSFYDDIVGFKTQINDISLSAVAPTTLAPISLKANANDAYLNVSGKALLTDIENETDIKINLKNLKLPRLSPYSAKFLGKEIDTGLATLFSHVRINKGVLNVSNNLNIDNLVLGKSVQSKDALNLPIDMAIAILRDFKNQIDISLPISASINDPSFHISGVVIQAITQMLTDVVFSPFKFIGKTLGIDASKLSSIDFALGSSELLQSESEKAGDFKKIAEEKGFKILIYPSFNQKQDALAIAKEKLSSKASSDEIANMANLVKNNELNELALKRANAIKSMFLEAKIDEKNIKIENKIINNAKVTQEKFIGVKIGISK